MTVQYSVPVGASCRPDPRPGLRRHRGGSETVQELSALVVLDGRAHISVDGIDLIADHSRAVIVASAAPSTSTVTAGPAAPYRGYWIALPPGLVDEVGDVIHRPEDPRIWAGEPTRVCAVAVDHDLGGSVRRLLDASRTQPGSFLVSLYLRETVYGFLIAAGAERLRALARHELDNDPVKATIEQMRVSLDQPLTVAELAEQVHMSSSALSQRFMRVTGQPPYQYLKTLRLEWARELLRRGMPVSETALRVGYASCSQFSGQFKRHFGQTPGSVRQWSDRAGARPRCEDPRGSTEEVLAR